MVDVEGEQLRTKNERCCGDEVLRVVPSELDAK
jgi:hypothetical protein